MTKETTLFEESEMKGYIDYFLSERNKVSHEFLSGFGLSHIDWLVLN